MSRFAIDGKSYDTKRMLDLDITTRENGGVRIEAVYMTKGEHPVVIVQTYSIWQGRDGCHVGRRWHIASQYEIGAMANEFECDALLGILPDETPV